MTKLRVVAAMMLAATGLMASAAENKPPNVVIFLTDDLSRNDCTIYNPSCDIRTPNSEHHTHIDRANPDEYWFSWSHKAATNAAAAAVVQRYHKRPAEELYGLKNDPYELRNLAAMPEQAGRLAQCRAELDAWSRDRTNWSITVGRIGNPSPKHGRIGNPSYEQLHKLLCHGSLDEGQRGRGPPHGKCARPQPVGKKRLLPASKASGRKKVTQES